MEPSLKLIYSAFLIGLQHLDFNDPSTLEEIRKINPAYGNAISRDVADRGQALAERIDQADGSPTASDVAKVLLMSSYVISVRAAETPLRGLTDGELIETLADPLLVVSDIKGALSRLQGQAWYLFQGIDQRVFFGQTANVTAEIRDIAQHIERVDETLRDKLREVFKPKVGQLYSEKMAILLALDEIKLDVGPYRRSECGDDTSAEREANSRYWRRREAHFGAAWPGFAANGGA